MAKERLTILADPVDDIKVITAYSLEIFLGMVEGFCLLPSFLKKRAFFTIGNVEQQQPRPDPAGNGKNGHTNG